MISVDASTVAVLLLACALAGLLIGILPVWRRAMSGAQRLPVWAFLRRRGAGVEGRAAVQAQMRCALCGTKAQCERQLAAGANSPVPGCPNLELFRSELLHEL